MKIRNADAYLQNHYLHARVNCRRMRIHAQHRARLANPFDFRAQITQRSALNPQSRSRFTAMQLSL
jgi:hypothetical protein